MMMLVTLSIILQLMTVCNRMTVCKLLVGDVCCRKTKVRCILPPRRQSPLTKRVELLCQNTYLMRYTAFMVYHSLKQSIMFFCVCATVPWFICPYVSAVPSAL